jgi:hypothetical protein
MRKVHGAILNALLLHIAAQALRQTSNDFFFFCFPMYTTFNAIYFIDFLGASRQGD